MILTSNEKYEIQNFLKDKCIECANGDYPAEEKIYQKLLIIITSQDTYE